MPADRPERTDDEGSGVSKVAPVVHGRGLPTLPRVVVVALVVGVIAFLAGVQLKAGRTAGTASPSASLSSPSAAPSTTAPSVGARPGTSEFAGTFRPQDVIVGLDGGAACVGRTMSVTAGSQSEPSGTFVRVWMILCSLEEQKRESFVDQLTNAIGQGTPGSSWSTSSDHLGSTVALFPYAQAQFVGTVTLAADAAGAGLEIVITLEERLAH